MTRFFSFVIAAILAPICACQRQEKDPAKPPVIEKTQPQETAPPRPPDLSTNSNAEIDRARSDIKTLDTAVTTYHTNRKRWPEYLQMLTQRDPIDNSPGLLSEESLIDPWGSVYGYDPSDLNPVTGKPRIWSNGPPDGIPFDNWHMDMIDKK